MTSFNVIIYNINGKRFEPYDVMPYFVDAYKNLKKKKWLQKVHPLPKTFDDFKTFVEREAGYQFWSRCEYEIILGDWPPSGVEEKWDVYNQIMMNIDIVVEILMRNLKIKNGQ